MIENLEQLFKNDLKYMYDAEKQLANIMPVLLETANSSELKTLINKHVDDNQNHIRHIENIAQENDVDVKGESKVSKGMEGLQQELKDLTEKSSDLSDAVLDAALISALQRVQHYEIASYGTLKAYAEILAKKHAAEAFQEIQEEEKRMDISLTDVAMKSVNYEALEKS